MVKSSFPLNKKNIIHQLIHMDFISSCQEQQQQPDSRGKLISNKIHISSPPCNIQAIYLFFRHLSGNTRSTGWALNARHVPCRDKSVRPVLLTFCRSSDILSMPTSSSSTRLCSCCDVVCFSSSSRLISTWFVRSSWISGARSNKIQDGFRHVFGYSTSKNKVLRFTNPPLLTNHPKE